MDIHYRPFNKSSDYSKQRKLFGLSFPETIGTTAIKDSHYNWKFEKFPYKVSSYQYVASEPQELVGYYAALPYHYQIDGKQYLSGMVCDVMTHPDRRGKGIFTKIGHFSTGEMKNQEVAFTTGYPIRSEVIPGHIKVGWKIVLELPMYLRLVGVKTLLPKPIRFLALFINPFIKIFQSWTLYPSSHYDVQILSREEFFESSAASYQLFLEQWLLEQENALIKSLNFLSWRTGAPESLYKFILIKKDSAIVGLSIARPTLLKGVESLAILDFMILKNHFSASGVLHQAIWKIAKEFNKDVIVCMTSNLWAKKYKFSNSLYLKTPAVFSLIIKKLSEEIKDQYVFSKERWHLFWIDSDDV